LKAKVQLIVYDDFECPYCLRHEATLKQIMAEYGDKIVYAFRHFPLSFHENAEKAAEASECAAEQGKFWEMHDQIFADNEASTMGVEQFIKDAKTLGLNVDKFTTCLNSGKYAEKIQNSMNEAATFGVNGTPGNFINGQLLSGALPYEQLKAVIDAELAK
jgi:protein-disulfide isomerase